MRNKRDYITLIVIFVLYHVIAFVPPLERVLEFWVSYVFGILSILLGFISIKYAYAEEMKLQSKIFRIPIIYIGILGTSCQVLLSIVFMVAGEYIPVWIEIVIFILIVAIIILSWIANLETTDSIERLQKNTDEKILFIQLIRYKLEDMCNNCEDADSREKLLELLDLANYSDPVSNERLFDVENQLQSDVEELEIHIKNRENEKIGISVQAVKNDIARRNMMCKMMK